VLSESINRKFCFLRVQYASVQGGSTPGGGALVGSILYSLFANLTKLKYSKRLCYNKGRNICKKNGLL